MFWEDITPILTPRLTAAVGRAYAVFGGERFRGPLICCTCPSCMTQEQAHDLVATPLRYIPSGLMAQYVGSAHEDTPESRAQFRHFLPRILDLVAQCNPPTTTSLEVQLFRIAGYRQAWPAHEAAVVDEFCLSFIEASIGQTGVVEWPVGWRLTFDMGDALGMVMRAGGDLAAALAVLDAGPDPAAALHLANLRSHVLWTHGEYRFMSAFWEDYAAEARMLGEFLMRDAVPKRLEAAVDRVTDERHFDVLDQGLF